MPDNTLKPETEEAVREAVADAAAAESPLEVLGTGSKRGLGRPVIAQQSLSLSQLTGISLYEPAELVLTAAAGTPLDQIRAVLAEQKQHLAFEPPDWGPLYGGAADAATIGGVIAGNLSGPRRLRAGAARDHLLGARLVTGRGEIIKTGGRVVKNVTGYDLCKLLAGSFGTFSVLTEITVKVLPAPQKIRTVLVFGQDAEAARAAMTVALNSPHEVSAAAWLPDSIAARCSVGYVANSGSSVTALRIEGPEPSVVARCDAMRALLAGQGAVEELHYHNSAAFWAEIGDAAPFSGETSDAVWRLSIPPAHMPRVIATIADRCSAELYTDWGGGLIWARIGSDPEDAGAGIIRGAITTFGGHATLMRASEDLRARIAVFQPQPPELAALSSRVKHGFDPKHVLNRGRMVEGV
jgi:glycolate oxidase FAD binding subunit